MKKIIGILIAILICAVFPIYVFAENTSTVVEFTPQYVQVGEYEQGYMVVYDTQYRIIDQFNNIHYTSTEEFTVYSEFLFSNKDNNVDRLYNFEGKELASFVNEHIIDVRENTVLTLDADKNYVLTDYRTTQKVNLGCLDKVWLLDGQTALMLKAGVWSLFDLASQKNNVLNVDAVVDIQGQLLTIVKDGLYGLVDISLQEIVEPKYEDIIYVGGQYLAFYNEGNDILTSKGELLYSSSNCFTSECINGWVIIYGDALVIKNIYTNETRTIDGFESVSAPYEGYMCGQNEFGLFTYVTMDGKQATDLAWDMVYQFSNGLALVYDVLEGANNVYYKQWYIINTNFEIVKVLNYDVYIDPQLDSSTNFSDGYIRTIDNETGLMGFIYLENYSASSNNQLKLSPTSLYQIDRESQTLSEVFKDTTVKDFKNHFLNDTEMLRVINTDGNTLNDAAYVVDGCKVQLISKSDGTMILDELTIKVSEKIAETDPPTTGPDNPIDPNNPGTDLNKPDNDSDVTDFIDSIADKVGVTSDQLLMLAGGSLAALVLLIIVITAIKRKRR